jgi:Ca-activated chloride channel family protein
MDEFHFLRPLWLLAALPAVGVWYALWRRQDRAGSWRQVVDEHLLEHLVVGEATRHRLRPIHLLLLTWIVSTIALAGPAWRLEPSPFADDEAGLMVVLKVSGTMQAGDVAPSRLQRAKLKLRDLLELREGTSTGLIVYSGSAHLVMPLTRDDRIVSAMIEDLTPELMPVDGDALLQALRLAQRMLEKSGVPGSALVIADNVSPQQAGLLATTELDMPVQFLSMQAFGAAVDGGLKDAAAALDAPVVEFTAEQADVQRLAGRAASSIQAVSSSGDSTRWLDAGYSLLPLLAFIALMWSRKGWLVN